MNDKRVAAFRKLAVGLAVCIALCTGAALAFYGNAVVQAVLCAIAFVAACTLLYVQQWTVRKLKQIAQTYANAEVEITRDPLTDVYDRETALLLMDRYLLGEGKQGVHGLLMLDLNHLAAITGEKGTDYGDMVLMSCAERIIKLFRKTDIIGRLGGNAFVIFLKNVGNRRQLEAQAATLLAEIGSEAVMPGLQLTCQIGGAVAPEDAQACAQLLQLAESALERAKGKGGHTFALFHPQMDDVFSI